MYVEIKTGFINQFSNGIQQINGAVYSGIKPADEFIPLVIGINGIRMFAGGKCQLGLPGGVCKPGVLAG